MPNYQEYIQNKLSAVYPGSEARALAGMLVQAVSGVQAALFLADKSKHLNEEQRQRLDDILRRMLEGEPVQYVLGEAEFYGMGFAVDGRVLIPRPETEELVEWLVGENGQRPVRILDVGTGSGCIAVAAAKLLPLAQVEAWDVSAGALEVARGNARRNGVEVLFRERDVLGNVVDGGTRLFDVVVSNPPYIMESEKEAMHQNVLGFEPHLALFVDDGDPLLFYREIAKLGLSLLKEGGKLYFEINEAKGAETASLLKEMGYMDVEVRKDLSGKDRMVRGIYTT